MHIIGILIAFATLIFWLGRAARGAEDIADAANTIANIPRKRRFQKSVRRSGLNLVETPLEAATILMVATARMSDTRRVTEAGQAQIMTQLRENMQLIEDDADGMYRQMESLMHDVTLPENALLPMLKILQSEINRDHAEDLAVMMEAVARADGEMTDEQKEFIRRFRERMNLLG